MRGFCHATIRIPSFHGLRYEHLGPQQSFCVLNTKEKTASKKEQKSLCIQSELRSREG